jgi:hypothetical protein
VTYTKSHRHLAESLENDEAFLSLLRRESMARTDNHREEQQMSEAAVHYDQEVLLDYSMGLLGDEETDKIMQHIAACRRCAFRMLEMSRAGEEMKKEVLEWVNSH